MGKVQMLICDDNPAISKSLAGYFEAEGMDVLCAGSGEEALALFRERKLHLIVLDVMLPAYKGTAAPARYHHRSRWCVVSYRS